MDMLARRKSTGRLTGELLANGRPADARRYVRMTAYVPQHDNFVPVMTALEVMEFYAGIILPRSWGAARRAARGEEVLQEMGLSHARRTLVGGVSPGGLLLRGLSGGERKRLSIATGILAAPSVVFLDEPTTGLDSFAALTVRGQLRGGTAAARGLYGAARAHARTSRPARGRAGAARGACPGSCQPRKPPPLRVAAGHGLPEAHGPGRGARSHRVHPPAPQRDLVNV